jgi:hypothetical protein
MPFAHCPKSIVTHAIYPTVETTPRMPIQPLIREVLSLHDRTKDIDHDGLCAFGWYHLHIAVAGRSWLRIGDREWEIVAQDVTRHVADARRRNSRLMSGAWARIQPRQPSIRDGLRALVIGRDGRRAAHIYKTDAGLGTRTECGIGYDIRRLSNKHRHLFQRTILLAELLPAASGQMIKEMAESGWWPEHAHQRPPGMWRSRFRQIQESLRWTGKHIPRKHVHKGREQWELWKQEKLPPPPAAVSTVNGPKPESAAEAFFRQVYGEEKLK